MFTLEGQSNVHKNKYNLRLAISLKSGMMTGLLAFPVLFVFILQQAPGCHCSCFIAGPVANCALKNLYWVPVLPPNITHLYLEMNHIAELNATSLSGLELLQELDLGRQYSPLVIRDHTFTGQRHLKKLVLGFNIGLRLEPQAFLGLSSLQSLHLDYCSLPDSILQGDYLKPLTSLETLDLCANQIKRLQPSLFFTNMTNLKHLNLKLNQINKICEPDLAAFQGKHFESLNLDSNNVNARDSIDWHDCGNPFRGLSFTTLDLSYNGLSIANLKQFFKAIQGTKISHLKLSGHIGRGFSFSNLQDVDRSTFEGLMSSSVSFLDLSKNRIFALHTGVFSLLPDVNIIDLHGNKVNQIHQNTFEGLEGLKLLNLSYNLLGEIYSHSFAHLINLRVLDLSNNHIGALGYQAFQGLLSLKILQLTGNSLRQLGFPSSLPSLNLLDLKDNRLKATYDISAFAPNVEYLNIEGNRLEDLQMFNLKQLQQLFYGDNPIKCCTTPQVVSNVAVLDLHSINLQSAWSQGRCLDIFNHLTQLLSLNLSSNALRVLPEGIFKSLTSLVELDLSSNALTHLQPRVFPNGLKSLHLADNFIASPDPAAFRSLGFLDLKMNRFHCDSNLRGFLTWMKETNVTFLNSVEDFRCEHPVGFREVRLLDYYTSSGH
uniref:toll-like receptor 5 n=1 Tax=Doryrhamphus excisus TaxID=161450 RepID=UPI0025ADFF45|nr:toll-like receptor 5 [Doryrhamphus excisus]